MCKILSSANIENLTCSLFGLDALHFFLLPYCSHLDFQYYMTSGESGHPCVVPHCRGSAFNFSPFSVVLLVDFPVISFSSLR